MDWLYLALLTPLLWSMVVLIDDNLLQRVYRGPQVGAFITGLFGALPLLSLLWRDMTPVPAKIAAIGMAAGFMSITYYYYYFKALEKESPSVVIAILCLAPVILPFLAYLVLGESLSVRQVTGFAIVVAASFLLAATDIRKFKFSKAMLPTLVAAGIYALVSLSTKYTYDHVDFYTGYMYFACGAGLGGLLYLYALLYLKKGRAVKEILQKNSLLILIVLAVAEFINIAAEFLQNLAISRGPVSLVRAVENVQPIYMLLIALLLYPFFPAFFREAKEGRVKVKLVLMTVIVIGVAITVT